jgi:drug/metabolite transporter (DMT)-like permease
MRNLKNARVMMVISMVAFGTLGLFVRHISVSSGELALYRAVLATILLGAWFLITGQRIDFRAIGRELPLLLLSGVAMGFNWILLFQAYRYTTVSVATLSYYFAPVLVTLACPILFREKMGAKQWICFAMSTLGIALITGTGDLSQGSSHLIGILFGLGAAVLYATVVLLNKFIKGVAGLQRTFLQFVAAVLVLVPYVACTSGVTLGSMDGTGWVCLLVVGLVHTGVTYCLYFSSLRELPGQEAAILSYMDPLVAVLISVFALGEPIGPWQIVGGALILGFTLWNEIKIKKE